MRKRRAERLLDWMQRVEAESSPRRAPSLITGLCSDLGAVTGGLTLFWSSGPVKGNVTTSTDEPTKQCASKTQL